VKSFAGVAKRKTYRLIPLLTPVIFRETVPLSSFVTKAYIRFVQHTYVSH